MMLPVSSLLHPKFVESFVMFTKTDLCPIVNLLLAYAIISFKVGTFNLQPADHIQTWPAGNVASDTHDFGSGL